MTEYQRQVLIPVVPAPKPRRRSWPIACVAAAVMAAVPAAAGASNSTHPRTPVTWGTAPCMTVHDRSATPVLHFDYEIPFEDTDLGPDEVTNSRTQQFFALCRPLLPDEILPGWITQADLAAAAAKNLIDPTTVPDSQILELAPAWNNCWWRITADEARRPITFAAVRPGVDWDTTELAPGVYILQGYTYEPPYNLWSGRPGIVKLHDGDEDAVGPAAAIMTGDQTPYRNDRVTIEACLSGAAPTAYGVQWAPLTGSTPRWNPLSAPQEQPTGTFSFEFEPPMPTWGLRAGLQLEVTDGQGRSFTTYMPGSILVTDADNPQGCLAGGSFVDVPCETDTASGTTNGDGASTTGFGDGSGEPDESSTTDNTGPGTDDSDTSNDPGVRAGAENGCGCTGGDARPETLGPWILGLGWLGRRRRATGMIESVEIRFTPDHEKP